MLREIAEFDRTEAWRGDGSLSMRDWLIAQCHVSRARARTLVDSASKVKDLPALAGALSEGRLTLDVFAPLAAVATTETDADLAQASEHWTPRQARQLASEVKGATDADAAAQFQRRFVRFDDERCLLWAQLTRDRFAVVKSAVLGRARRHDHPSANDPDYARFESRCADALVEICVEQGRRKRPIRTTSTAPESNPEHAPVHGGARTTMIVHTDLDRLLYGDGYGHASIEGAVRSPPRWRAGSRATRTSRCRSTRPTALFSTRSNWSVIPPKPSGSRSDVATRDAGSRVAVART